MPLSSFFSCDDCCSMLSISVACTVNPGTIIADTHSAETPACSQCFNRNFIKTSKLNLFFFSAFSIIAYLDDLGKSFFPGAYLCGVYGSVMYYSIWLNSMHSLLGPSILK